MYLSLAPPVTSFNTWSNALPVIIVQWVTTTVNATHVLPGPYFFLVSNLGLNLSQERSFVYVWAPFSKTKKKNVNSMLLIELLKAVFVQRLQKRAARTPFLPALAPTAK